MSGFLGIFLLFAASLAGVLPAKLHVFGFQQPGGRDPVTNSRSKEAPRRSTKRDSAPKPRLAELMILLPNDCQLFLDGQLIDYRKPRAELLIRSQKVRLEYSEAARTVTLKGLKPDLYVVSARRQDYEDYSRSIEVAVAASNVVAIALQLKPGTLTVSTGLRGAQITLTSLETGARFGPYTNELKAVEISPGPYRLSLSHDGYHPLSRDVTIRPGETIYLEPKLEPKPIPTPTPTPIPKPVAPVVPQSLSVERSGKYLIFRIVGSSGNSFQTLGTINTLFNETAGATVEGVLPGVPSRVSFVKLENVADGSLVETPAPSNQWSLIVVRIRPKDSKRAVRFAINWISVSAQVP